MNHEREIIVTSLDVLVFVLLQLWVKFIILYFSSIYSSIVFPSMNVLIIVICFSRCLLVFEFDERSVGLVVFLLV